MVGSVSEWWRWRVATVVPSLDIWCFFLLLSCPAATSWCTFCSLIRWHGPARRLKCQWRLNNSLWCSRSTTTSSCRTSAINSHTTWFCQTYFYSLSQSLTPQIDRQNAYTIHNPSNPQFRFWESHRKNKFLLKIGERIKNRCNAKRLRKKRTLMKAEPF